MKKMKRIVAIVKSKGPVCEMLDRRVARINRAVASAIDCSKDYKDECIDKANAILDSLSEVSHSGQTAALNSKLMAYCDEMAKAQEYQRNVDIYTELAAKLQEEITVEDDK